MLPNNNGVSALYIAAQKGHLEVARALMEVGGRERAMLPNNNGVSSLFISAHEGHLDVARALMEVGRREGANKGEPVWREQRTVDAASWLHAARASAWADV